MCKDCDKIMDQFHKEEEIIERFFVEKPNIFGYRKCKLPIWYRLNKNKKLERSTICNGSDIYWESSTWKEFNESLKIYFENINKIKEENDVTKLDWNF